MADFHGELEDLETGERYVFASRSDYLASLYGGGVREVQFPPSGPSRELPDNRHETAPRRIEQNDDRK